MGACPFCGGGNNTPCFATYDNGYNCFTCGKKKAGDRLEYAYRPILRNETNMNLPEHTQNISEFSPTVLKWLYSYYVYDDLIKKYGISYVKYAKYGSFEGESLILPVIVDKKLVSYQQRFFPNKKFLTKGDKSNILYIECKGSDTLVLVEDYISAIRVGEHAHTICLQGVHMMYHVSKFLENIDMNIEIWLDPDKAGVDASVELLDKLKKILTVSSKYRAFAIRESRTVSIRTTEKQPKDYSGEEIKEILGGVHGTR
jgi:hypothetical protein